MKIGISKSLQAVHPNVSVDNICSMKELAAGEGKGREMGECVPAPVPMVIANPPGI